MAEAQKKSQLEEFDEVLEENDLDLDISDEEIGATADDSEPAEEEETRPEEEEEAPTEEAAAEEPAKAEKPAATPEAEAATLQPTATSQEPIAAQETPQEQAPQMSPQELLKAQQEATEVARQQLAAHYGKLAEAVSEQWEANPAEAIAGLLTQTYLDAVQSSIQVLLPQMPQIVQQIQAQSTSESQYIDQFFETFPKIDRTNADHWKTAERLGQAYRVAHPDAPPEQLIQDVGIQTMLALKLPFEGQSQEAQAAETEKAQPFRPAASSPPRAAPKAKSQNPISEFDAAFEDDGLDLD